LPVLALSEKETEITLVGSGIAGGDDGYRWRVRASSSWCLQNPVKASDPHGG
jgi:hypothetical protein